MKRVIIDIFRRWWWVILIFAVLPFVVAVVDKHPYIQVLLFTLFYGSMIFFLSWWMTTYKNLTVLPLGVEAHGRVLWVLHSGIFTLIACVEQLT
ncbi:MAG: hypothetical protein NTU83_12635, partial [Candidatus Hydrogenedentes bacterium]|nr:hypothetical protein [Candidatus Hydrogenedentota bacterium]